MRGRLLWVAVLGVLGVLVISSFTGGLTATEHGPAAGRPSSGAAVVPATGDAPLTAPSSAVVTPTASGTASQKFDQRVLATAHALAEAGVAPQQVRLPYVGRPAEVVDGAVVPGYALPALNGSQPSSGYPVPTGLAYYGENDTNGTPEATVLNASSVAGTLTVNQMDALYLDVDTPDMWGIQLNSVLGNVTLQGVPGYQFWVQNSVDVFEHNQTINLGDDTWNFSSPSAYLAPGNATIAAHNPNGSIVGGLYVGEGPWLYAPLPFTLSLYVNSSLTGAGDQELWYNYSLSASGGIHESGSYDWVVFRSAAAHVTVPIAPFVANGTGVDPVGLPNDFEFDFGIGAYNGATMDVLSANVSATLDYCPVAIASCAPGELRPVPAAENFGSETGETSSGLCLTYNGTHVNGAAGPMILRGLWGFQGSAGGLPGSTPVTNDITVSGAPDPSGTEPYVFVFLATSSAFDTSYEWTPDVPVWHLAPGTYQYAVVLADYAEQVGMFTVGAGPVVLSVVLPYHPSSGVYTPLWALDNAGLAGISISGNGTLADQYVPFNTPTAGCTECGGAPNGNLSPLFFMANDYLYPTFPGILLDGTNAYVDLTQQVSFCVGEDVWGLPASPAQSAVYFDLQIEFVSTEHVTLAHDAQIGGWPAFFETETLAGFVNASQNPFPQGSVMIWNSTGDLVMSNEFVATNTIPDPEAVCIGLCPAITCGSYACVSPVGLLLYGGSKNTVWGNTFRDPAVPQAPFAGLAEAESGDLIYNNNFSVNNPTVYLPFDIYNDSCPDGYAGDCGPLIPPAYADRWNVTPQPADQVSDVANGFALEGTILGATCGTQGGNYWNDYGNALNPSASLPFVNRYNYSEIVSILPPGADEVQASITVGGDFAPLTPSACGPGETLRFHETGLPAHASWSVELAGGFETTSTGSLASLTVPSGLVTFTLLPSPGYGFAQVIGPGTPTYDSVNVTGPTLLAVRFGALETVYFNESTSPGWPGLPTGTAWGVSLTAAHAGGPAPTSAMTNGTSLVFSLARGSTYRFTVSRPAGYQASGGTGSFTVPGHPFTKKVKFRELTAPIRFVEHGLPGRTNWSVTITPTAPAGPPFVVYGSSAALTALLTNGSYTYTIAAVGSLEPTPSSGTLSVAAPHGGAVPVAFRSGALDDPAAGTIALLVAGPGPSALTPRSD